MSTAVEERTDRMTWENIRDFQFYLDIPEPVHYGPTWQIDEKTGNFVQPEHTLGWQIIRWVEANLLNDEGAPFVLTFEQKRLLLWWYAVDERGRFVYRKGVFQRLKGWGKDPLVAVIAAVEFVGPCRFAGWLAKDRSDLELRRGDPLAKPNPKAWIQIAAVSKEQTKNTMKIFPTLFTEACKQQHGIDIGKEVIYAYHGGRTIEAVTSAPATLEGARPSLVIKNETHHWKANNEGHEMAAVIGRNTAKSKGGAARTISITNAYEPSQDSVGQREREAWENERDGLNVKTGVLYDSVEAHEDAYMRLPRKPDGSMPTDEETRAYVGAVVDSVRGDAWWLDVESILGEIFDEVNPVSQSRRFYYNQIVNAEDAWLDAGLVGGRLVHPLAKQYRAEIGNDDLRAGWQLVLPEDPVAMFFDGSKSDDATALVGCRLDDGYVFTLGVWQRPRGERGKHWLVPREEVDARVIECAGWSERDIKGRFNVVAFFGDPSHALDDEDSTRYWDGLFDRWHQRYKDQLQIWATKTGNRQHAVMWDMTSPLHQAEFVAAAERFVGEAEHLNDIEEFEPDFQIDGHPALVQHLRNAKKYPTKYGVSLWKGAREAEKKIDLAVAAVGARMVRRMMTNVGLEEPEKGPAELWGKWSGMSPDQYTEGRW
jgi:hypothetical protein